MTTPDVVYPVRPGESNEELKFSLRSLRNIPHGRVWVVGYKPAWVRGVEFIKGNDARWSRANLWRNLTLACDHPDVAEDIIIMNDDMFVVGPVDRVPTLHRGPLSAQVGTVLRKSGTKGWWQESLATTLAVLRADGHDEPTSYELHTPFPCSKVAMGDTLACYAHVTPHNPPQWRTLHGVRHGIGGTVAAHDCKAVRPGPINRPFHSTDDLSWRYFRARFLRLFPDLSPYERPIPDARSLVSVPARNHLRSTRRTRA